MPAGKKGRRAIQYEGASSRTKERRYLEFSKKLSVEEIIRITMKKMSFEGNKNGAQILKKISSKEVTDEIAARLNKPEPQKMTPESAVDLLLVNRLTKTSYKRTKDSAISLNHDIYPSYDQVSYFS